MSYTDKIQTYQSDCAVLLGRMSQFSDYIKEFANLVPVSSVSSRGLDLGAGPGGCNSQFFTLSSLDGCDAEPEVVKSLTDDRYNQKFVYRLGKDQLPYSNETLDFVICSCVIQHLSSVQELEHGLKEIYRVLKPGGHLYLMYKVGTHDTLLTHHNSYYDQERTFRVFSPNKVHQILEELSLIKSEYLLDDNYIPYSSDIYFKRFKN
ncbi:MAG: class I SAM-dependent methyltransferase [Nitrosopumilus sp.]|nr:class I SAM-dependent methyltransferase [Nitrosopumilus sp.]